ncbi:MAG: aminotransferase class V-fold PLP-dependent enzyme [Actinomycetota bacterium]|nr:aminotransferase class V-fold PLP-dependent enzyme [Actinomycetota bacterium]
MDQDTSDDRVRADLAGRDALLDDAQARARRYLSALADRRVAPSAEALAALDTIDRDLPEAGRVPAEVLAELDDVGAAAAMASAGGRFFGFVNGGALPVGVAAAWLTAAWDQNAALSAMAPGAARFDAVALRWIADLLGLPAGAGGAFVTGATMANATALAAARDAVLTAAGWDAAADGLVGAPPVEVVVGAEAHATIAKAAGLVGLGRRRFTVLPVDDQGRIVASSLPEPTGPAIVCLQAGNVNSGASDPFKPLVEWAHEAGAWVHVDGAFGLWAAASPATAGRVAGMEGADSWATDGHKWLNLTYDSGICVVRDPAHLAAAVETAAPYLVAGAGREPMHYTPQSSSRARGFEAWATLSTLGRSGVAELVERTCAHARRFADRLGDAGFEILNEVALNQVVVALPAAVGATAERDAAALDELVAAVQRDGTCWVGPTTWHGRRALRISVSSWATTTDDVDRSVDAIVAARGAIRP